MYYIVRIRFTGETASHSIEAREDYRVALGRFHNVIAADLGTDSVTYCATFLLDENMKYVVSPFYYSANTDAIGDPHAPFEYLVGRVYISNGVTKNSIEYKSQDEAYKRYFNILAADLQNNEVTYNGAFIINEVGRMFESRAFDRTPPPEEEPEEP